MITSEQKAKLTDILDHNYTLYCQLHKFKQEINKKSIFTSFKVLDEEDFMILYDYYVEKKNYEEMDDKYCLPKTDLIAELMKIRGKVIHFLYITETTKSILKDFNNIDLLDPWFCVKNSDKLNIEIS